MSRKGLFLFLATGLAWGMPYFFIRIAAAEFSAPMIIFARTLVGAAVLIPLAIKRGVLKETLKAWPYVLAFAVLEMVGPWWLLTTAEGGNPSHINSGLAGLLIATVPFFGVFISYFYIGDKSVIHPKTLFGLAVGFIGLVLLVGIDSVTGAVEPIWVGAVILAAIGYAIAPAIISKKIPNVPSEGVISVSMVLVAAVYVIPAFLNPLATPTAKPSADGWIALAVLGVVCSAIAFALFFELIREIGSMRASTITYMNTVIAIVLGVTFLSEPLTPGMMIGIPLVIVGSIFATRKHK
ncbi:MAG: EamA family transporter [Rhodoluna sp.]|jgi:drug/metabolite transporter (DMT)-like permease|nr:EamA family transporter [Rhodoluna sp.]